MIESVYLSNNFMHDPLIFDMIHVIAVTLSWFITSVMSTPGQPVINDTSFGSIAVEGQRYEHDIIITLEGQVKKRKKKLSKSIYGTSHTISLPEIKYVYQDHAEGILIGSGQYGMVSLSEEASEFLERKGCSVLLKKTDEAIEIWNGTGGNWIGLFHITC